MKKLLPLLTGVLAGVILTLCVLIIQLFLSNDDPRYDLIAVSWGSSMSGEGPWIYQIQVISDDANKDGVYEVYAKACIGSSDYYHDFGEIGTARTKKELVDNFSLITWEKGVVTIGGISGQKASIKRAQLEKHR